MGISVPPRNFAHVKVDRIKYRSLQQIYKKMEEK